MPTVYNELNPKHKIVSVYNKQRRERNLTEIELDDYNFSVPQTYSGTKSDKNTVLTLTPRGNSAQFGKITIYYNRINLSTVTDVKVIKGSATTVIQLLPNINEELGIELTYTDVEEAILGNSNTFTLTASPLSLIFTGSTEIGYYT